MEKLENVKFFLYEHRWMFISILLGIVMVLGCGFYFYSFFQQKNRTFIETNTLVQKNANIIDEIEGVLKDGSCYITVDVKGEVKKPGIYQIKCDSRVQDAISFAGGTTWNADTSILNLSKKLVDEMVIIVYSKDQVANFVVTRQQESEKLQVCQNQIKIENDACIDDDFSSEIEASGDTPVNNVVSLNKATKEELMTLSGIGESKAEDIIDYREKNDGFKSIEEIKNIKGIGDSIFEKIKANITI